jgi:hypothetical protein
MSVLEEIRAKAKALHRTVILPEGNEDRTLKETGRRHPGRGRDIHPRQRGPPGRRSDRGTNRGSEDVTQGSRVCHPDL